MEQMQGGICESLLTQFPMLLCLLCPSTKTSRGSTSWNPALSVGDFDLLYDESLINATAAAAQGEEASIGRAAGSRSRDGAVGSGIASNPAGAARSAGLGSSTAFNASSAGGVSSVGAGSMGSAGLGAAAPLTVGKWR